MSIANEAEGGLRRCRMVPPSGRFASTSPARSGKVRREGSDSAGEERNSDYSAMDDKE